VESDFHYGGSVFGPAVQIGMPRRGTQNPWKDLEFVNTFASNELQTMSTDKGLEGEVSVMSRLKERAGNGSLGRPRGHVTRVTPTDDTRSKDVSGRTRARRQHASGSPGGAVGPERAVAQARATPARDVGRGPAQVRFYAPSRRSWGVRSRAQGHRSR
jgi:hypothetical protein